MGNHRICCRPIDLLSSCERWDRTCSQGGNRIEPLVNGEQAYPAMMDAITQARDHIFLSIYQFDDDGVGSRFAKLFDSAKKAGTEVRVILDAWGDLKSNPSIRARLLRSGVEVRSFHSIRRIRKYNQRYHRKLLLIDGEVGYTGGMNVRDRHLVDSYKGIPMRDTVFEVRGPVLGMLEALFMADWQYCGGQADYEPSQGGAEAGAESVIVLGAGPPLRRIALLDTLVESIENASTRVIAVTPFFFPDGRLLRAFDIAAGNGATVDVMLPTGDYEFLRWCAGDHLGQLLQSGCSVYLSAPPYDHSKILIVDNTIFIGTVNLDRRSLYYNWEVAMMCSGGPLLSEVSSLVEEQRSNGTRMSFDDLREGLPSRLAREVVMRTIGRLF